MNELYLRQNVFETNSSSSHAANISSDDAYDLTFDADMLRAGAIVVRPHPVGYGSNEYRYITPEAKLAYILVHISGGDINIRKSVFQGGEVDILPLLIQSAGDERRQRYLHLIEFVREKFGCKLMFVMDADAAYSIFMNDWPDELTGVLSDDLLLSRFLFSSQSYVQTGHSDNYYPFERHVDTDLGQRVRFQDAYIDRKLPRSFSITYDGDDLTIVDDQGERIGGKRPGPIYWEEPEHAYNFLKANAAEAHLEAVQVGKGDLNAAEDVGEDLREAFKNFVHYIYVRNENRDWIGFNLTVNPNIQVDLRGISDYGQIHPINAMKTGFSVTVNCDDPTLEAVKSWYRENLLKDS